MLAGVPLALARNMPGAGPANLLILSMLTPCVHPPPLPPLAACNPEVVGSTPPPSIELKTVVFTVFFALQGCETQVKCTFLRFSGYHSIWVALIAFKYSMKKKVSSWARPPTWPCWLPFGGRFFFVTFKLPFHALPLLSPHSASFRSFTPGASSFGLLTYLYHFVPPKRQKSYWCLSNVTFRDERLFFIAGRLFTHILMIERLLT